VPTSTALREEDAGSLLLLALEELGELARLLDLVGRRTVLDLRAMRERRRMVSSGPTESESGGEEGERDGRTGSVPWWPIMSLARS